MATTKLSAFRLGDKTLAQIEALAKEWGLDKTAVIRRAIEQASTPDIGSQEASDVPNS